MGPGSWAELSEGLVAMVKASAASVVRVDGRRGRSFSGIVWSSDGVIVTASHGLDSEDETTVGLLSGETVPARVVGRDPTTDLAVLELGGLVPEAGERGGAASAAVAPAEPGGTASSAAKAGAPGVSASGATSAGTLQPVTWSDAPLEVGQLLLSVTRPGRGPKAGLGLVSRLGDAWRTPWGGKLDRYVELDLGLHPGFSGGLLLDMSGRGLGLATAGLVRSTPLAIPPATLRRVVASLLAHGSVRRGYLGVTSVPARLPAGAVGEGGTQTSGLLLTGVEEGSPAARAGLMVGDILLSLDGVAVEEAGDLMPLLEEERIGTEVSARFVRGGAVREVTVTLGARSAAGRGRCG